jgi:hypothetical protein
MILYQQEVSLVLYLFMQYSFPKEAFWPTLNFPDILELRFYIHFLSFYFSNSLTGMVILTVPVLLICISECNKMMDKLINRNHIVNLAFWAQLPSCFRERLNCFIVVISYICLSFALIKSNQSKWKKNKTGSWCQTGSLAQYDPWFSGIWRYHSGK